MYAYRDILNFNIKWSYRSIITLALLAILPNWIGMYNTTIFGFKIHFFQYLIFTAAMVYGPVGGIISGAFGSVWTAINMHNPYILIGNMLLGFLVGVFIRLKWNVILAVLTAYIIQMPWLWLTDVYLAGMPVKAVNMIVVALLFSDLIMGVLAGLSTKHLKKILKSSS
ncbi:MAG: hypothetical protein KKC75_01075 [Nanoarchaeota archaeon]|nr:hypothetical protein [Nanoarchaeota archaeon]MBU1005894.1 hypothetical protein [Nanoarchaeota archaeon]MBU1946533.1 hypothetical protein [Nanoarchaeota archaeon]